MNAYLSLCMDSFLNAIKHRDANHSYLCGCFAVRCVSCGFLLAVLETHL